MGLVVSEKGEFSDRDERRREERKKEKKERDLVLSWN